jgi:hypothetical protein
MEEGREEAREQGRKGEEGEAVKEGKKKGREGGNKIIEFDLKDYILSGKTQPKNIVFFLESGEKLFIFLKAFFTPCKALIGYC